MGDIVQHRHENPAAFPLPAPLGIPTGIRGWDVAIHRRPSPNSHLLSHEVEATAATAAAGPSRHWSTTTTHPPVRIEATDATGRTWVYAVEARRQDWPVARIPLDKNACFLRRCQLPHRPYHLGFGPGDKPCRRARMYRRRQGAGLTAPASCPMRQKRAREAILPCRW